MAEPLSEMSLSQHQNLHNRGSPPFKVRSALKINQELKTQAIPLGFINKPIYTYMDDRLEDRMNDGEACPYPSKVKKMRKGGMVKKMRGGGAVRKK